MPLSVTTPMARDPRVVERIAQSVGVKTWPSFVDRASCDKKEIFLNGGWRGGKSTSAAFLLLVAIILEMLQKPGSHLVWLVASDYKYTVPEFNYILEWTTRLGFQSTDKSTPMQGSRHVVLGAPGLPGTIEIETKSADDPTSLGGRAPDWLLACEAGLLSEEARFWILGRTAEKNATVVWSGTFENDENKQQFAWFEEESEQAWTSPSSRRSAFRLPTWENMSLYDSCSQMIQEDPSLATWCPSPEHGTAHSGSNHPMIRKLQDQWKDRPKDWLKRFGGEAVGTRNPVYEWAELDRIDDISGNKYLISLSQWEKEHGPMLWLHRAGGIDPGLVHPAGLVYAAMNQNRDIWFVDAKRLKSSNNAELYAHKDLWQKQYRIRQWGGDPVGLKYTRPGENIIAMTGSVWGREERAAIVNSYAIGIDNRQHLYFNADSEGCRQQFAEAKAIHRKVKPNGEWGYNRVDDDLMAAGENAVVVLHSKIYAIPKRWKMPSLKPVAAAGYRGRS